MSKRDFEKKIRQEQEATAHVFQEFINSFQETPAAPKTFVKSGILYADKNQLTPLENQLYKPTPLIKSTTAIQTALECAKILKDVEKPSKKSKDKPKSNLELLKEELKIRHSEKTERERLKEEIIMSGPALSYFDGGDPNSTNLFVANLNVNVTEADLMEKFGAYGPLASVKIMWPRGEEKYKNINTNCGFVAFMSRRDAERALSGMKHRTDMRVGWGKSVDLPPHPVYIPQELLRFYLPPPQTGLPFNAQPNDKLEDVAEDLDAVLLNSMVKVTIPLNKKVVTLVNRMIEFVVKEGPLFEAMIMNNELNNPDYSFLFDNKCPTHVYYRWKLFSILQGEATKQWSMAPFRMFQGGSIWLPPVAPNFRAGMPEELTNNKDNSSASLSDNQCERLIEIIQCLTLNRDSIAEAMVFCLNHLSAINDSLDIIVDSLCNSSTKPANKIARFYLLSDVLSNCHLKDVEISNVPTKMELILNELHKCFLTITQESHKILFGSKVMRVVQQLKTIGFLEPNLVKTFQDYFFNTGEPEPMDEDNSSGDEPLDGASLLKRSLKNSSDECVITSRLKAKQDSKIRLEYFVPSKWDTVDPEEVEAQSMSSTKLYFMELDMNCKKEEIALRNSPARSRQKHKKHKSERKNVCSSPERHSTKHKEKKRKIRR